MSNVSVVGLGVIVSGLLSDLRAFRSSEGNVNFVVDDEDGVDDEDDDEDNDDNDFGVGCCTCNGR